MKERLIAGGALAGLLTLIAVGLLVFQFGREDPSPPSLEDTPNPDIPGELLYRDADDCLVRAAASGATREQIYCGYPAGAAARGAGAIWIDERTIGFPVVAADRNGYDLIEVDLETKAETVRPDFSALEPVWGYGQALSPAGERATVNNDGVLYYELAGERTEVAKFGTDGYRLTPVIWSPDGQWLLLAYSPPRGEGSELWIVSRDGLVQGTLVSRSGAHSSVFGQASWIIPGVGVSPILE